MAGEDTLTAAEEQALARARQKVGSDRRSSSRSSSGSSSGTSSRSSSSTGRRRSRTRRRRRGPARSATLDTARGALLLLAIGVAAVPETWLPPSLAPAGGDGFGLTDLVPGAFALLAGVALDHQTTRRRRQPGRWWAGRLARRVVTLAAVGLALTLLVDRDLESLRWTSAYARLGIAGVITWFLLRDLSRRAQVVVAAAWVVIGGMLAFQGRELLPGVDGRLLGPHAAGPVDPDGLVGILASTALMLAGAWLGSWLRARPPGPATATAFALTATYVAVAGVGWAQLSPVNALRWTGPALLLGAALGTALLALGHLATTVLPTGDRVRWVTATGAVALPVGVGGLVVAHLLGVGAVDGTWHHIATTMVEPVVGTTWGALALGGAAAAGAARAGAALVDRGWLLRA